MSYLGDISLSQVLYFHFTTRQFSTGTPITAALLAVSIYKDDSTTESTTGITTTFSSGFDGVVGLVSVKIDTSADGTFYASGHDFSIVVTGGTSDGVSIIGEVVGYFSIQNRSALRPTTAGRTINIDSTGLSDSNMVKLGPTGSGTAQTARDIGASVLVGDKTGFSLTSAYDPAKTAAQAGDAMTLTTGERTSIGTAVWVSTTRTLTSFGTLVADTATAIWTSLTSALTTVGSIGKLLVDNINATITSRMATYTQPTGFLAATFPGAVASTTNITAGTITTVTNLTNAPTVGDFTGDMKTSLNAATPAVTVSDKTGFSLTAAYDAAKTAAQAGDTMKVSSGTGAGQVDLTSGKVNVGKMNDATLTGTGQPADLWRGA